MSCEQHYKTLVETITDPKDCIAVALAMETLSFHNKNFLDIELKNTSDCSMAIQQLLKNALNGMQ